MLMNATHSNESMAIKVTSFLSWGNLVVCSNHTLCVFLCVIFLCIFGSVEGVEVFSSITSSMMSLNLYAPNEEDPGLYKEIAAPLAGNAKGAIIIGGDFNCVVNQKIDRRPSEQGPKTRKAKALYNMMEELGLVDIWHLKHPRDRDFMFFSKVHNTYSRIDCFYVSKPDVH